MRCGGSASYKTQLHTASHIDHARRATHRAIRGAGEARTEYPACLTPAAPVQRGALAGLWGETRTEFRRAPPRSPPGGGGFATGGGPPGQGGKGPWKGTGGPRQGQGKGTPPAHATRSAGGAGRGARTQERARPVATVGPRGRAFGRHRPPRGPTSETGQTPPPATQNADGGSLGAAGGGPAPTTATRTAGGGAAGTPASGPRLGCKPGRRPRRASSVHDRAAAARARVEPGSYGAVLICAALIGAALMWSRAHWSRAHIEPGSLGAGLR